MIKHWEREIENLKKLVLSLGALVEDQINLSMIALERRDIELAEEVIDRDNEIDTLEIEVEEECLKILALYQPVAKELRFVVAVLKMNNDLERIGDLAANIAKRARYLSGKPPVNLINDFPPIAEKVKIMVKRSLDSMINTDENLAKEVCASDDEVDDMTTDMLKKIISEVKSYPDRADEYFSISSVSKSLERIADAATNLAEDVVYLCSGEIIRHKGEVLFPDEPVK